MSGIDPRFARLQTDPRFRRPKQKHLKAEIDERFKDILSDDFGKIEGRAKVDKRGRKLTATHAGDQMKRFYRLKSPEEGAEAGEEKQPVDYARGEGDLYSSGSEDESDESEVEEEELELGGKRSARLRFDQDDSESEDDSDDDHLRVDLDEDEEESAFPPEMGDGEDEDDEENYVDATSRLAVVNLDWEHLRAGDLYTIFNSFLQPTAKRGEAPQPAPGKLMSVRIYPSEFGKERMAKEDELGPGGGIFLAKEGDKKSKKDKKRAEHIVIKRKGDEEEEEEEEEDEEDEEDEDEEDEDEEDEEDDDASLEDDGLDAELDDLEIISDVASEAGSEDIDMEKLRQYQLERLRYYYAIATFSTVAAAELVHNELNGTEFERTANVLDLSYVPEDMTFADDEITDEATKEPKHYKGNEFVTDALRHSKVKLTWDQDDPNRVKLTRRALSREEIEEQDFANLVAGSDSEDEEEDEEEEIGAGEDKPSAKKTKKQKMKERKEKLRQLLLGGDDETADIWGKQGTAWQSELADLREDGGKGKDKKAKEDLDITFRPGLSKLADEDDENMTSLERYKLRQKERKREKKEKIELRRAEKSGRGKGKDGEDDEEEEGEDNDDFFGEDSGESDDDEPQPQAKKGKGKDSAKSKPKSKSNAEADAKAESKSKSKPKAKQADPEDDPAGLVEDPSHHFNIKDMLQVEKDSKKKRSRKRKGKKDGREERELELGPEGFKVDVADPRFAALYNEPAFAIDPTHPKFMDTAANREILKRTRELHAAKRDGAAGSAGAGAEVKEKELGDLVASVKRKAAAGSAGSSSLGEGKKRKRSRK